MLARFTDTKTSLFKAKWFKSSAYAMVGLAGLCCYQVALAVPPTFTILGPREFQIPLPKPGHGLNFFFQNAVYVDDNKSFDNNGAKHSGPNGHTFLGVSRIGHIFTLENVAPSKVGFFWEYLQPEAWVQRSGQSTTGFADPLIDLSAYVKPTPHSTIGINNIINVPVGQNDLSNHDWQYDPSLYIDWLFPSAHFGLDNTIGASLKSAVHQNGINTDEGNEYYDDFRIRFLASHYVVPFLSYDYDRVEPSHGRYVQQTVTSNGVTIPVGTNTTTHTSYQHIAGAGTLVYLNKAQTTWFDLWYDYGFKGKNQIRVNGIFARYVYVW